MKHTRRQFIKRTTSAALALPFLRHGDPGLADPPIRPITHRPAYHWFGYYDKLQFDPTGRFVLGMEVDFEGRSPHPDDVIGIGMVDTEQNDRWIEMGRSRAWGWQQGCMLQWRPESPSEILWNDREQDRYVTSLLDVNTGEQRTLPKAIYALSPDGRHAVCTDFARIDDMRPGYGYRGVDDSNAEVKAPDDAGIYRMNLSNGNQELVVSYAEVAQVPHQGEDVSGKWHYFNHLLVNPDSSRFLFLNRYRDFPITEAMRQEEGFYEKYVSGKYTTRMFTANMDGSDLFELDPGHTSHIIWRDPRHVLAWTSGAGREAGYWLFEDQTRNVKEVGGGVMTENGHQTYLPGHGNEWILNDSYPDEEDRKQTLYLYHVPTRKKTVLGRFYAPPEYTGEWRTDLHPRSSPDGTKVVIDSTHGGEGRQMYLIDIKSIVD